MQVTPQSVQVVSDMAGETFRDIFYTVCDSSREVRVPLTSNQ